MGFIYKVTNTVNGKMYIGQTSRTIEERWKEHLSDTFGHYTKFVSPLHRAILKYGLDAFAVEQIEACGSSSLDERERYWIKHYNTHENGYNADFGGRSNRGRPIYQYAPDGTFIRGFETLGDAQEAIGGKIIMMSSKRSHVLIGGYLWRRYKVDKLDVEGHPKEKPVHQYSIDGDYIATYNSLKEAAVTVRGRNTGTLIGVACRNDRDTAYGYRWSFDKVDVLPPFTPYKSEKRVVRISLDGTDTKVYNSIREAAEDNNVKGPNIIRACKDANRTSKGYIWRYYDQLETAI